MTSDFTRPGWSHTPRTYHVPDGLQTWADTLPTDVRRRDDRRALNATDTGLCIQTPDPDPLPPASTRGERPSLTFDDELEHMTAAVKPLLRGHFEADAILEEFPYGKDGYRTDLVVCCLDGDALQRRYDALGHTTALAGEWARIKCYDYLRSYPPVTREAFVDGRSPYANGSQTARKTWDWLNEHGFLARLPTGHCTTPPLPAHATLHAIELKPRDWETALEQAARADGSRLKGDYNWRIADYEPPERQTSYGYADYRWVVMDGGQADTMRDPAVREQFRDAGVGLMLAVPGGLVVLEDADECDPPDCKNRLSAQERALAETPDARIDEQIEKKVVQAGLSCAKAEDSS